MTKLISSFGCFFFNFTYRFHLKCKGSFIICRRFTKFIVSVCNDPSATVKERKIREFRAPKGKLSYRLMYITYNVLDLCLLLIYFLVIIKDSFCRIFENFYHKMRIYKTRFCADFSNHSGNNERVLR